MILKNSTVSYNCKIKVYGDRARHLRQHTVGTYKHHTLLVPQLKQPTTIPLIMEKRGRMNKDSAIESHFS